jgi:epoxide hydrolase-like predicted phosphatase
VSSNGKRGLLVDYGGVLTTNVFDSFRDFCVAEGLDPGTMKDKFRSDPEAMATVRGLERGELTEDEFSERMGAVLGVADHVGLVDRMFAGMRPDEAMLDAVRAVRRAGIPTGLISNSMGEGRYDRSIFPTLFDGTVISGEVGLHKPDPAIYCLGAERIGLTPEDCVFVDDLRENCAGAETIGMTAVLHRGAAKTVPQLERLLGVSLA